MFRSMTSDVSALSGVVAKGHQAMHFVSSTPSKIPYGGFSPVRLQNPLNATATFAKAHAPAYRPSLAASPSPALVPYQDLRPSGTENFKSAP